MDPVSLSLLAVGTVGVVSYCRNEHKRKVKATRGPTTLSEMLANLDADGLMNWPVLAVHVRSAHIAPHLAGGGLMARVKVGEEGASVSCDTEETMATLPARPAASWFVAKPPQRKTPQLAVADFGSTCLFQGQRKGESFIRIRLLQAGSMGKTVAKASLRVTCSGLRQFAQMEETELQLYGRGIHAHKVVGRIHVAADMCGIQRDSLPQYLHLLQMQKRNGAFRVMPRLFTEGHVHDTTEREACALLGQAVEPSLLEAEQSCGDLTAREHS
mmetsp:Transcript_23309/g.48521  ORF Transcript_23309/g.48521 Transcript_23309/m.48521 type:complete len:271 (+) Transcript_23309:61-873(+)